MNGCQRVPTLVLAAFSVLILDVAAQRGPSEEVRRRSGSYFITATLPAPDADSNGKVPLAKSKVVEEAAQAGELSLLYLYDPTKLPVKHPQFEQTIFGHGEISLALLCFRCARVDLTKDETAYAEFAKASPLFVAFDAKGKVAGQVSFHDYRARATPLIKLFERAARKHAKLPLKNFVTLYRRFLNDYKVYEGRKKTLGQKRDRLRRKDPPPAAKLAEVDKEEKALELGREKLLEHEKELLEKAGVATRSPRAQRLGDRRRR